MLNKRDNPLIPNENEKPKKPKKVKNVKLYNRNKLTGKQKLGISLIIVVLISVFIVEPYLDDKMSEETIEIAITTMNITKGNIITDEQIITETIPKNTVVSDLYLSKDEVVGKYATLDMYSGEPILNNKVSNSIQFENNYLYLLEDGKKAMSITLPTLASSVSSKIIANDIVSVYSFLNDSDTASAILNTELTYLKVLDVSNSEGSSTDDTTIISTITFEVNDTQANLLATLENTSTLHIALVSRGDEEQSTQLLAIQEEFILQIEQLKLEQEIVSAELEGGDQIVN